MFSRVLVGRSQMQQPGWHRAWGSLSFGRCQKEKLIFTEISQAGFREDHPANSPRNLWTQASPRWRWHWHFERQHYHLPISWACPHFLPDISRQLWPQVMAPWGFVPSTWMTVCIELVSFGRIYLFFSESKWWCI